MKAASITQQHLLLQLCGKALVSLHYYFKSVSSSPLLAFPELATAWNFLLPLNCVVLCFKDVIFHLLEMYLILHPRERFISANPVLTD